MGQACSHQGIKTMCGNIVFIFRDIYGMYLNCILSYVNDIPE